MYLVCNSQIQVRSGVVWCLGRLVPLFSEQDCPPSPAPFKCSTSPYHLRPAPSGHSHCYLLSPPCPPATPTHTNTQTHTQTVKSKPTLIFLPRGSLSRNQRLWDIPTRLLELGSLGNVFDGGSRDCEKLHLSPGTWQLPLSLTS